MNPADQQTSDFFAHYTKQQFRKGETIIWGDQDPDGIYYLVDGHVRQCSIDEHTGNTIIIHIFHPGSFFPMIWALAEKRNTYFFEAMGAVTVYRAPKESVLQFLQDNPAILYSFTKRLLAGLDGMSKRLETYAFQDVYGRLVSELLYLAKHFGTKQETGIMLPVFTHQELANFIGSARETTTIAIEKLERSHLLVYMGHNLYIPSLELLVAELNKKRPR